MEISWTNRVRNKEVLCRVQEEKKILHTIEKRKTYWIFIPCVETAFKHILLKKDKGKIVVKGRRRRRCKQVPNDLKEMTSYCKLKEK